MDYIYYSNNSKTFTYNRNNINFINKIMYETNKKNNKIEKILFITNLIKKTREELKNSINNKDKTWWIKEQNARINTLIYIFNNIFCDNTC